MREADIGVIGGGFAGSLAAAMLGRGGHSAMLIDAQATYQNDFRCEKMKPVQGKLLAKTGLDSEAFFRVSTLSDDIWLARFGRIVDKRPNYEYGFYYPDIVNAARSQVPDNVEFVRGRAIEIATSDDRQTITLQSGEQVSVRLIMLATGNNNNTLREQVGIERHDISKCHSVTFGFDIESKNGGFDFAALTYHQQKLGYISLFPIGSRMRVNMFVYIDRLDPWIEQVRQSPEAAIFAAMPGLRRITGGFNVTSAIVARPVDLYQTEGYRQARGIVLVGDSFATSCPSAGTGTTKVLTDTERLCNRYIPQWLATPGMGIEKIAAYYDDPDKQAADAYSIHQAKYMRAVTIGREFKWRFRRVGWFGYDTTQHILRSIMRPVAKTRPIISAT